MPVVRCPWLQLNQPSCCRISRKAPTCQKINSGFHFISKLSWFSAVDHCCPICVEFIASHLVSLMFSEKIHVSQNQGHRRVAGRREGDSFFVYREIPIDENNLSNEIHDRCILHRLIPEDLGPVRVFVHDRSACRGLPSLCCARGDHGFRAEYFCLSVSPDKQKVLSASSAPLR